jgi:hypothetical protein
MPGSCVICAIRKSSTESRQERRSSPAIALRRRSRLPPLNSQPHPLCTHPHPPAPPRAPGPPPSPCSAASRHCATVNQPLRSALAPTNPRTSSALDPGSTPRQPSSTSTMHAWEFLLDPPPQVRSGSRNSSPQAFPRPSSPPWHLHRTCTDRLDGSVGSEPHHCASSSSFA